MYIVSPLPKKAKYNIEKIDRLTRQNDEKARLIIFFVGEPVSVASGGGGITSGLFELTSKSSNRLPHFWAKRKRKVGGRETFLTTATTPLFPSFTVFSLAPWRKEGDYRGKFDTFCKDKNRAFCSFVQKSFFAKEFANSPFWAVLSQPTQIC